LKRERSNGETYSNTKRSTASVCNGTATITATGTATGGTYYELDTTMVSITVSPSTTTEYTVVYTLNGCPSLEQRKGTVTVKPIQH
jgi:hypothetical protein